MNTVTLIFLAFLAGAAVLYYVVPKKIRWVVLLIASIGFYAVTDKYLIAFVCLTTISVYFGARGIQKNNDRLKKPAPLKEAQPAVAMSEKQDAQVSQETGDMANATSQAGAADSANMVVDGVAQSGAQETGQTLADSDSNNSDKKRKKKAKTPLEGKALKEHIKKQNKALIASIIILNLAIIGFLKYFNFFGSTVNSLLELCGAKGTIPALKLFLPLGISFYTLQALGYLIDVYRKKIRGGTKLFKSRALPLVFPSNSRRPYRQIRQARRPALRGAFGKL